MCFKEILGSTNIEGIIDSYAEYLFRKHPLNLKRFKSRRDALGEAALAEAVVFGLLQSLHLSPEIHEDIQTGGPDFVCAGSTLGFGLRPFIEPRTKDRFVVEATCLEPDAVTARSTIPNEPPEDVNGGPFSILTKSICYKARDKATQLGGYPVPRVLAVASSHAQVGAIFNTVGAEYALTSDAKIVNPMGSVEPRQCTDLRTSVFLRIARDRQAVVPCLQSISAILLIAVYRDKSEVYGILHPEPAQPLQIGFFPKIPFVRLTKWPVTDGIISTEWVVADPDGRGIPHRPVRANA
jgi:hypothetical protein